MPHFTCTTALITGASAGIGAEFARQLAKPSPKGIPSQTIGDDVLREFHLVLAARRLDRLQAMKAELEKLGAAVEPLSADLATEAGIQAVADRIRSLPALDLLINNAGYGVVGPFAEVPVEVHAGMLRVHNEAAVRLTHAALQGMLVRGNGAVINVASISGYMGGANGVMYGATKSFLVMFSAAVNKGLKGSGVQVQALCPGFTHTEFHEPRDYMDMDVKRIPAIMWTSARAVTAASLKALDRKQVLVVPGLLYKLAVFFGRLGWPVVRAQ
jgi:short-subunit dehydrogenase